jgi:hypothetical protein
MELVESEAIATSADDDSDFNVADRKVLTSIDTLLNSMEPEIFKERYRCGITEDKYRAIAKAELACLKLLLTQNSFSMEITQPQPPVSYFCFKLMHNRDVLGETTCSIMWNDAATMLGVRSSTTQFSQLGFADAQIPVVQMEFTRLHVNGFKGAEIIQRYILCLCAYKGIHIMIKDIMTDYALLTRDWNWNINCVPREDLGFSGIKYVGTTQETGCSSQSTQQSVFSVASSMSSVSSNTSSASSCDSQPEVVAVDETKGIPKFNPYKIDILMDYFIFQNKKNANIPGLFERLQNGDIDVSNKEWTDFITAVETTLRNKVNGNEPYFGSFYARFYRQDEDDIHNNIVRRIKEQAEELFLSRIPIFLEKMQYIVPGPRGELPDFTGSPESKLYIDELFKKDFTLVIGSPVENTHFITNLIDIAERIKKIDRFNNRLNFQDFISGIKALIPAELLIYTGRTRDVSDDGSDGKVAYVTRRQKTGTGGNSTKKKQHKNKRSSKRKKNKKRAIKTQKNKLNKTRK